MLEHLLECPARSRSIMFEPEVSNLAACRAPPPSNSLEQSRLLVQRAFPRDSSSLAEAPSERDNRIESSALRRKSFDQQGCSEGNVTDPSSALSPPSRVDRSVPRDSFTGPPPTRTPTTLFHESFLPPKQEAPVIASGAPLQHLEARVQELEQSLKVAQHTLDRQQQQYEKLCDYVFHLHHQSLDTSAPRLTMHSSTPLAFAAPELHAGGNAPPRVVPARSPIVSAPPSTTSAAAARPSAARERYSSFDGIGGPSQPSASILRSKNVNLPEFQSTSSSLCQPKTSEAIFGHSAALPPQRGSPAKSAPAPLSMSEVVRLLQESEGGNSCTHVMLDRVPASWN